MTSMLEAHRQRLIYQAVSLGGVCFLVSILLLIGHLATEKAIDYHGINDRKVLLQQVLPSTLYNNDPLTEMVRLDKASQFSEPPTLYVARKDGVISGAAIEADIQGWGGQINFILAVDADGKISGVRIISHKETPGLADKIEIEKDDWILDFNGKSLTNTPESSWRVKKDQGEFDQFTGATITPRAVVKGVHQALLAYNNWRAEHLLKSDTREETR